MQAVAFFLSPFLRPNSFIDRRHAAGGNSPDDDENDAATSDRMSRYVVSEATSRRRRGEEEEEKGRDEELEAANLLDFSEKHEFEVSWDLAANLLLSESKKFS